MGGTDDRKRALAERQRRSRREKGEKIRAQRRAKYWRDVEANKAKSRAYYAANKERAAAQARGYRKRNRERYADRRRLEAHGITRSQFRELWNLQAGRCAVCHERLVLASMAEGRAQTACVDHDHATGVIRGLLCSACNRGLGFFRDRPILLRSAADYLEQR